MTGDKGLTRLGATGRFLRKLGTKDRRADLTVDTVFEAGTEL